MTENCLYFNAQEVQEMLGISRGKAYNLIKGLNVELAGKGYITLAGKVPKQYLLERVYGAIPTQ